MCLVTLHPQCIFGGAATATCESQAVTLSVIMCILVSHTVTDVTGEEKKGPG